MVQPDGILLYQILNVANIKVYVELLVKETIRELSFNIVKSKFIKCFLTFEKSQEHNSMTCNIRTIALKEN